MLLQEKVNLLLFLRIFLLLKQICFIIMAIGIIFENVPVLYSRLGKGDKGMQFSLDNKYNYCADKTYKCLNAGILTRIGEGFYISNDYENALEIINLILSQSEEDLLSVGNTITAKIQPYYRSGMIYMKWGEYDKAIKGFTEALKLSLENEEDNQWWEGHYYQRLGLVYSFMEEYTKASNAYLAAIKLNENIDYSDDIKTPIKSICSYGYIQELIGHSEIAKENMIECENWIGENPEQFAKDDPDYHAYEIIWPLYLYYDALNQTTKASKYLLMAYEVVGKEKIEKYHTHPTKDTDPRFFYCRDIITTYETSLNQ